MHKKIFPQNKWYNSECKQIKKHLNNYAKYHDFSVIPHGSRYMALQVEYKKVNTIIQNKISALKTLKSNPEAFWKFWKSLHTGGVPNSSSKLTLSDFIEYFKK